MKLLSIITTKIIKFIYFNFHTKKIINTLSKKKHLNIKFILDIGAHRGETVDILRKSFTNPLIYCFEPQYENFIFLKNKFSKNKKVKIFNYALGNKNGNETLRINVDPGTSTIMKFNENSFYLKLKTFLLNKKRVTEIIKGFEKIKIFSLDNIKFKKNIDMLKIDVEGYEEKVLKGSLKTLLSNDIKVILIEFHLSSMFKNYNRKNIENLLKKRKYKLDKIIKFPLAKWEDRVYIKK